MAEIRPLTGPREYDLAVDLQLAVWGPQEVTPRNHMIAIEKSGGVTLGALEGDQLVAFCMAWPGVGPAGCYLYSHMLAVRAEVRGHGLGKAIKWAEREWALQRGFEKMVWTFDPFQFANARLNMERLGARATRFIEDCYGQMEDALNWGLPSDRFLSEWDLLDDRVVRLESGESVPPLDGEMVRLPFPKDINGLKQGDLKDALKRRLGFRQAAVPLFGAGYEAVAVESSGEEPAYLLRGAKQA